MTYQPTNETTRTMPTYRRTVSPNELSYFLPSRAYGLNDMCTGLKIHAPPSLISPLRVRIAWAIMRLRHSLLACRVEMPPGKYDEAEFVLTPPSTSGEAMAQAAATIRFFDDATGTDLMNAFLNGPRALSSDRLSAIHIARHGEVSPGTHEFHLIYMLHHMINDPTAMYMMENNMLELLGGSATPGGPPHTDRELAEILDREWMQRCGAHRIPHDPIVAATEDRIQGLAVESKFRDAAWLVDHQNIQKRSIGGHVFPRLKNRPFRLRWREAKFDVAQSKAIMAQCKAKRVTLVNMVFALYNFAWIRLCASRPELIERKDLPMLMYTAISTRRYLKSSSVLDSYLSLALEYHNVVLPTFIPRDIDPVKIFWARGREAQRQMFRHAHSPLLLQRSVVSGKVRGERAKVWARLDDESDGTLPPTRRLSAPMPQPQSAASKPATPSLALLGISSIGDPYAAFFRSHLYPNITVHDLGGMSRKAPGGMLASSRIFKGSFAIIFMYDEPAFAQGLMEEFWRYVVDGVHEYVLRDKSLLGTAKEMDMLKETPFMATARL